MTNKKRVIIISISVAAGTILSGLLLSVRRGQLSDHDYFMLGTNLFFSLLIILAIGWFFVWRKK